MAIKLTQKNIGREVTLSGKESTDTINWVAADGSAFRIVQGEGIPVVDYTLEDVDSATELLVCVSS